MIVAMIGSRTWTEHYAIARKLEELEPGDTVVSGGARGADLIVAIECRKAGIPYDEILPNYEQHGSRAAPLIRNKQIVDTCDRLIAFWDGTSRGTAFTVDYAREQGKPVEVVYA